MRENTDNNELIIKHIVDTFFGTFKYATSRKNKGFYEVMIRNPCPDEDHIEKQQKFFQKDLQNHLINDAPLKLVFHKSSYTGFYKDSIYRFFESLMAPVYYDKVNPPSYKYAPLPLIDLKIFNKIIILFEQIMSTVSIKSLLPVTCHSNIEFNPEHFEFTYKILSFDNHRYYEDTDVALFWEKIIEDIKTLEKFYQNQTNDLIKEGLINFLKNKEVFLQKYKNKEKENELLYELKNILHSNYWQDISLYLPSYKQTELSSHSIFDISSYQTYSINLEKTNIIKLSRTMVTDCDIYEMLALICDCINLTKLDGIDNIDLSNPNRLSSKSYFTWNNPKIYLSGEKMTYCLANKIISLFEKMLMEYGSGNVNKDISYKKYEELANRKKLNMEYLIKAAATYWLDLELGGSSGMDKKVNKI